MVDSLINTLLVLAGLYVYLSLFRQVAVRQNGAAELGERQLGVPEAVAAALLIGWFALNVLAATKVQQSTFQTRDLLVTGAFSLAVISILTALLHLRGFSVLSLGGFSRLGFGRIVSTAAVLLFAAYPLLFAADGISRWLLGEGAGRQQIVEMFTGSETLQQRILIIVLAVVIAPFAEEFIFRFFFVRRFQALPRSRPGTVPERNPLRRGPCASAQSRTALHPRQLFYPRLRVERLDPGLDDDARALQFSFPQRPRFP